MRRLIAAVLAVSLLLLPLGENSLAFAQRLGASRAAAPPEAPMGPLPAAGDSLAPGSLGLGLELSLPASIGVQLPPVLRSPSLPALDAPGTPPLPSLLPQEPLAPTAPAPAAQAQQPSEQPDPFRTEIAGFLEGAAPALEAVSRPDASAGDLHDQGARLAEVLLGGKTPGARRTDAVFPEPGGDGTPAALLSASPGAQARRHPAESEPPPALGAAALLGAASLPLGFWPASLAGLLLLTGVAALLIADYVTGAKLSRWALWSVRPGPTSQRVEGALQGLLGVREADVPAVKEFLAAWRNSGEAGREELISFARGSELRLPMLLGAYLSTPAGPGGALLLAELASSRARGIRLDPALRAIFEKRDSLPWLRGPKGLAALDPLARLLDPTDAESAHLLGRLSAQTRKPPRRAGRLAALLALSGLLTLTSFAGYRTVEFRKIQVAAAREARDTFWGEHKYVFYLEHSDDVTSRIRDKVLPALENWNQTGKAQRERLQEAVASLRGLADPRADNLLQALFERSGALGMAPETESELFAVMMERNSPQLWRYVGAYMAAQGNNPRAAQRLIRMIDAGAGLIPGNEEVFLNLFHFLASPSPEVARHAAEKLSESLNDPARAGEFLVRLGAASERHANPALQLKIEELLLERLAGPAGRDMETGPTEELFTKILDRVSAADRSERLKTLAGLKPGEHEVTFPVPYGERALIHLEGRLDQSRAGGKTPDALAVAARAQVHRLAKTLILEGKMLVPGLDPALKKGGVLRLPPSATAPGTGISGGVWGPGMTPPGSVGGRPAIQLGPQVAGFIGQVPGSPQGAVLMLGAGHPGIIPPHDPTVRDTYTLSHLRGLVSALREAGKAPASNPAQIEYLDRAQRQAARLLTAAQKAGILVGGTPGEAAATDVNAVLFEGLTRFSAEKGSWLVRELRRGGMTPDVEFTVFDPDRMFLPSHEAADAERARLLLARLLQGGKAADNDGKARAMTWPEKQFLASALERIETIREKHFPGQAKTAGELASGAAQREALFSSLRQALASRDPKAVDRAQEALAESFGQAWSKDLFLAQLTQAGSGAAKEEDFQLQLLRFMGRALSGPHAQALDPVGAEEALELSFTSASETRRADAWRALMGAFASADEARVAPHPSLQKSVRFLFTSETQELAAGILGRHPELSPRLLELGVLRAKTRFAYPNNLDVAMDFDGTAVRDSYGLSDLRRLKEEVQRKAPGEESLPLIEDLLAAGQRSGVREGGGIGERLADELNYLLKAGDGAFEGQTLFEALRKEGLAPGGEWGEPAYAPSYSAAELERLEAFTLKLLEGGEGWDAIGTVQPLTPLQRKYLADSLEILDGLRQRFYPASQGTAPLGRLAAGLNGDAQAQAAAQAAIDAMLDARPVPELVLARLAAAQTRLEGDPEAQRALARLLARRLAGRYGSGLAEQRGTVLLWSAIQRQLEKAGRPAEAWELLEAELAAANPALDRFVSDVISAGAQALVMETMAAHPGAYGPLQARGVLRQGPRTLRTYYGMSQLRALKDFIAEREAKTDAQRRLRERAPDLLARYLRLGERARLLPGDSPNEKAAERVNPLLLQAHGTFGGGFYLSRYYIQALRAAKLAPALSPARSYPVDLDESFARSYNAADLRALAAFHRNMLSSRTGWGMHGPQALTPPQTEFLRALVAALDKLASEIP